LREIAELTGCTQTAVRRALGEAGVKRRDAGARPHPVRLTARPLVRRHCSAAQGTVPTQELLRLLERRDAESGPRRPTSSEVPRTYSVRIMVIEIRWSGTQSRCYGLEVLHD